MNACAGRINPTESNIMFRTSVLAVIASILILNTQVIAQPAEKGNQGASHSQDPGQAKEILVDGFESGLNWEVDNKAEAVVLTVVQTNATEGTHALLIDFPKQGRDKVIVCHAVNRDLTSIGGLVLDATNPQSSALDVAIALQTGSNWEWFESKPVTLKPGLNKNVRFDLTGKKFKSNRTKTLDTALQYTDAVSNVAELQRINVLVYPGTAERVNLYLDNVRWEQSDSKAKQTTGSKPDSSVAVKALATSSLTPAAGEMLVNGNFTAGVTNWVLEHTEGAKGSVECGQEGPDGKAALRIKVLSVTNKAWHLQFYQTGPRVEKGRSYNLTFWAKSDRDSSLKVNCMQNHEPWDHETQEQLPLTTEWRKLHFTFVASWSNDNVRITFTDLGATVGQVYWLAKCSLVPALQTKPKAVQRLVQKAHVTGQKSKVATANQDWPSWQGPNGDGKSLDTGLLKEWPAQGPNLLWQADGIGVGFSSVAVALGKVYITGDQDGKLILFAFDLDGNLLWQKEHGQGRGGPDGSRASPVIDNGKLYLLGGNGLIGCYDAASGEKKWSHEANEFGGSPGGWGYAESVLIYKNMAIFKPGGQNCIVALDRTSGETIWKSSGFDAGPEYGSCLAVTFQGQPMIVTGTNRGIVAVDAANGQLLWSNDWSAPTRPTAQHPRMRTDMSSGPTAMAGVGFA